MNGSSRSFLTDNGEWMLNAVKRNPEGLLLLAAGAVLMLRSGGRPSGSAQSMAAAYDRGSGDIRQTFDAASDVARQTVDKAGAYASAASDYADKARRVVGEQSERVSQQARSTANSILQNQPLAVVAAGLAAGAVVAAAFPPTSLERETLGPIGDQVSKAAERFGDQVKEATSKASEKLKTAADQRGVNAEGLKQVADEVVDTFKSSLKKQLGEGEAPSNPTEPGTR